MHEIVLFEIRANERATSYDVTSSPRLDPAEPITLQRVETAARNLNLDTDSVRSHYEALAAELPLRLEWQSALGEA